MNLLCPESVLNCSFLYSDLARLERCDHPNLYGRKAEGKAVVIKSLFLLWSCSLYLFHGIRWTKNSAAAATGACWGICRAPRGGPTARGLHCENLLIRKSQLVEELLIFIHCQQTIICKYLYVVHRRAQLFGYLPPDTAYGFITVCLENKNRHWGEIIHLFISFHYSLEERCS